MAGPEPPTTGTATTELLWLRESGRGFGDLHGLQDGQVRAEIAGLKVFSKQLSPRALVVHKPKEACLRHGFPTGDWR